MNEEQNQKFQETAILCKGAYKLAKEDRTENLLGYLKNHDIANIETFSASENADIDFYIAEEKDTVFISFRGTVRTEDWSEVNLKIDFNETYEPICETDYAFHKGFYDVAKIFPYETVLEKYRNKNIVFSGHSLGGAVAGITALKAIQYLYGSRYENEVIENCRVYAITFGAPLFAAKITEHDEQMDKPIDEPMDTDEEETLNQLFDPSDYVINIVCSHDPVPVALATLHKIDNLRTVLNDIRQEDMNRLGKFKHFFGTKMLNWINSGELIPPKSFAFAARGLSYIYNDSIYKATQAGLDVIVRMKSDNIPWYRFVGSFYFIHINHGSDFEIGKDDNTIISLMNKVTDNIKEFIGTEGIDRLFEKHSIEEEYQTKVLKVFPIAEGNTGRNINVICDQSKFKPTIENVELKHNLDTDDYQLIIKGENLNSVLPRKSKIDTCKLSFENGTNVCDHPNEQIFRFPFTKKISEKQRHLEIATPLGTYSGKTMISITTGHGD